jgi:CBS domain-containing protein/sporulation protein YlmC with PRC-barrel domain
MSATQIIPLTPVGVATSASALMGRAVLGPDGVECGRVKEFAVDVARDGAHVAALVLRGGKGKARTMVGVESLAMPATAEEPLRARVMPEAFAATHGYLLLDYDLLDQQIIDVDGHKVVRVNDVDLVWEPGEGGGVAGLLILDVEVGNRGAMRRLFKGLPAGAVEGIAERFAARVIPWGCVDLIERDPARRVRLKIGQDRLAKLHPSDIAEILEELAPAEREAVFASLDEETAAETLEEVDPKLQKELLEGLDSERAAEILEEMDPGAAADVLSELSDEQSDAILEEMAPEERQDIEELLEFEAESAAGRMTTDFVSVPAEATIAEAITALREFEGDPDTITEIYLTGAEEKLVGVVTLPRLLLASSDTLLKELTDGHNKSCGLHASEKEVAEMFDKYNLRSLPVLDAHGRVAGAIHAEQVIALLREE